jgi:putative ABC transport system permease protein
VYYLALIKLIKNKWLFLSLTICVFLCVVAACVLPLFENALLGRMLIMSFNNSNLKASSYMDRLTYTMPIQMNDKNQSDAYYSNLIENDLVKRFKHAPAYFNKIYTSNASFGMEDITYKTDNPVNTSNIFFISMNNYDNNLNLIAGKYPSSTKTTDGYAEIMVSNDTAISNSFVLNRIYKISDSITLNKTFNVKIVGIFNYYNCGVSSTNNTAEMINSVVIDNSIFNKLITTDYKELQSIKWDYFLDYTKINVDDIPSIINENIQQNLQFGHVVSVGNIVPYKYNGVDTLKTYDKDKQTLTVLIIVFTVPMFLLLLYSIFFISKLVVEMDKNEISVLQSRGASIHNIALMYLLQSAIITILPFLTAPFIATMICRILGNTSGFLQFTKNIALKPNLSFTVYLFNIIACAIVIITMLIPSVLASRTSIVQRKLKNSEKLHKPFWMRFYLDFVLLAVSAYGYYNFVSRQSTIKSLNANANQLPIEPLTFLIMVVFLVAMGLFFMRFYPVIMKFISEMGRKIWSASFYSSIKRVTTLKDKEQFIILFIILTMSLGIFSTNSAQTINKNLNDYIMYSGSADMALVPYDGIPKNGPGADLNAMAQKPIFSIYKNLKGVTAASIISIANAPQIYVNLKQSSDNLKMIGVDPNTYADVVWSRTDMLDTHINNYLNMLAKNPDSCIISKNLADDMGLMIGDDAQVNTNAKGYGAYTLKVVAIINTWPTYIYTNDRSGKSTLDELMITNNVTLESKYKDVLYQILLKTDKDTTATSITNQLSNMHLPIATIHDYKADVSSSENSAQRQSLNALLTFSFLIIFAVCLMGFVLYWILSIRSRVLQFGILRAMGMSVKSIYAMLIYEQLFITLVTTIYSIFIGGLSSRIFVNILRVTFGADQQVLPFEFVSTQMDFIKIYIFFGLMFVLTFIIIVLLIKRIKIAQTIKLGED